MQTFKHTIRDSMGIHARPAGLLVKEAGKFDSETTLALNGNCVSARKIFAVMGLGAKQGDELIITIEGSDEEIAADSIRQFLLENI